MPKKYGPRYAQKPLTDTYACWECWRTLRVWRGEPAPGACERPGCGGTYRLMARDAGSLLRQPELAHDGVNLDGQADMFASAPEPTDAEAPEPAPPPPPREKPALVFRFGGVEVHREPAP